MSCNFESLEEQAEKLGKELKAINNTLRDCLKIGAVLNSEEAKTLEKVIENLTKEWSNFKKELIELLELMEKISNEEAKKLLSNLREKLLVRNLSEWLKKIEDAGYSIGKKAQKSDSFQKTFKQNRFKILENTRLENFDQVIYILERIFFGVGEQTVPLRLIEILADPSVPSEIKKSAVYLFLASFDAGVSSKKQDQEG